MEETVSGVKTRSGAEVPGRRTARAEEAAARAQGFFEEGYNCCQSVFLAFAGRYGFDRETACRLSASFGGGVGRLRQICGAVSAMALICGLETGAVKGADQDGKAYNYKNVQQLAARFEKQSGSLICRELLGLPEPEGEQASKEGKAPEGGRAEGLAAKDAPDEALRSAMEGGMGRYRPQARDERYYATRPCKRLIGLAAEIIQEWLEEREAGRLILRGGRVLDPRSGLDAIRDVWIREGKIERIEEPGTGRPEDGEILDVAGCYVMPGLIDLHVHLRDPGLEYKEDIASGSRAAARGGFTTICCMANTKPVADNAQTIAYIVEKAARVSPVHVIPVGAVTLGMEGKELADMGAMKAAGAGAVSEDGKTVMDAALCRRGMERARDLGLVTMAHCEHKGMLAGGVMNDGAVSERLGLPGFCNVAEDIITARDILLAEETGARLHLCHCSTAGSVELLRGAKKIGLPVTGEACPHHFTLTDEAVDGTDADYKMAPPLRSAADVAAIRAGLADGTLDCISTDHAPHAAEEKARGMREAPCGIVGLETAAALAISELVRPGYLTPLQLAEKMSANPARILGIPKGTLAVGSAADVTVIDPRAEYTIDKETFASKSKNTPFDGRRVHGRVEATIVDGKIVYRRGEDSFE